MEQARFPFQRFRRPLLGRAQPPAQAEHHPPERCAYHQVVDDDEVREALRVDGALIRADVAGLDGRDAVEVVHLVHRLNRRRLLVENLQQVANAEQIVAERKEQDGTFGELEARRFRPECDEREQREDEAQHREHQNASLEIFF